MVKQQKVQSINEMFSRNFMKISVKMFSLLRLSDSSAELSVIFSEATDINETTAKLTHI